jgi:hypothetical protein
MALAIAAPMIETMAGMVSIASLQSHGVRQLLVYCLGKSEGDWPCHHQGNYRLIASRLMKFCKTSNAAAAALVADGDELAFVPTTTSNTRRRAASVG